MLGKGFHDPLYAAGFAEFGTLCELPNAEGWLLKRMIRDTGLIDAVGLYPLFSCGNWQALENDLEAVGAGLVSVTAVCDPFGDYDDSLLERCFDFAKPYKDHFVADLDLPLEQLVSRSYRSSARWSLRRIQTEMCERPIDYLDEWVDLYDLAIKRHDIRGMRAFSRAAFEMQLQAPGLVMCRASREGRTVGLSVALISGEVAHGHLVSVNEEGYAMRASSAIMWTLMEHLKGRIRWLNLGGVPDAEQDKTNGLEKFKLGWSSERRCSYLCGRIFDHTAYEQLSESQNRSAFFPIYRAGEDF